MKVFRTPVFLLLSTYALVAQVHPRIAGIPGTARVRLSGTTHVLANPANDMGRAAAGLPMERMMLQLSSGDEELAALEQLLADQQDPQSARYRQWLTPEEFGARFGAAQQDIDAIGLWLESQGFTVNSVAAGRRVIEFSGTVRQVEQAFQTEIHRYRVNGVEHIANSTDISIPAALSPVVKGVVSLHNFPRQPMHHTVRPVPLTDLQGGSYGLSPYDFAAIYNVKPLWNANFDGTGQTVAIAGRTNINPNDMTTFRSFFGLPGNNTQVVLNGPNPGIISAGEETEADLDVEWSGGIAKGAAVKFVVSKTTNASDGIDLSSQYIVNNNLGVRHERELRLLRAAGRKQQRLLQQHLATGGGAGHLRIRLGRRQRVGRLRLPLLGRQQRRQRHHAREPGLRRERPRLHAL